MAYVCNLTHQKSWHDRVWKKLQKNAGVSVKSSAWFKNEVASVFYQIDVITKNKSNEKEKILEISSGTRVRFLELISSHCCLEKTSESFPSCSLVLLVSGVFGLVDSVPVFILKNCF